MAKFQPRERKQKAIRRTEESNGIRKSKGGGTAADPNAACIIPESQVQREERKKSLREELRAQAAEKGTKVSSKKAKRLDKYIDNKLRKDENIEILKKLSDARVDTSGLRSSKHLGKGMLQASKLSAKKAAAEQEDTVL